MKLLHNIGTEQHPNYNTIEQVLSEHDDISFDGVYLNVYENQDVLKGKSGILFVTGDYVGKDNQFDLPNVPKLETYCTWKQVEELTEKYDFEIGWHTWSHRDLAKLTKEEIQREVTPPFSMKYFAYPYGTYSELVIACVREAGFEKAWSVTQGNDNPLTLYRNYL
jgi:hypothetical protein